MYAHKYVRQGMRSQALFMQWMTLRCSVKEIYDVSGDGVFIKSENSLVSRIDFSVVRRTGRLVAGYISDD